MGHLELVRKYSGHLGVVTGGTYKSGVYGEVKPED